MLDLLGNEPRSNAIFAGDHRIELYREWGSGPTACVIGCNPARANADRNDMTSRWWINWFQRAGFGRYRGVNLYPFVTASPKECKRIADTIGNGAYDVRDALHMVNLPHVVKVAKAADQVFVCWGAIAWDSDWADHVVEQIQTGEEPWPDLWCWGTTSSGAPKHPLARGKHRIPVDQPAILWRAAH
jgi:hypothetical protein